MNTWLYHSASIRPRTDRPQLEVPPPYHRPPFPLLPHPSAHVFRKRRWCWVFSSTFDFLSLPPGSNKHPCAPPGLRGEGLGRGFLEEALGRCGHLAARTGTHCPATSFQRRRFTLEPAIEAGILSAGALAKTAVEMSRPVGKLLNFECR